VKLIDLRRMAIKNRVRVQFALSNGMECVVTEHGICQVPQLNGPTDLNLETELANARQFSLEPVLGGKGARPKAQSIGREELEKLAGGSAGAPAHDHEE
jgi:hypothetical protein